MPRTPPVSAPRSEGPQPSILGDRLRALRVAAGLTQEELAGDRFTKAYISQVENGRTRPTEATLAWLADRLRVDVAFLLYGVSHEDRVRLESELLRAEALNEERRYEEAGPAFAAIRERLAFGNTPELEVRALGGEAWALMEQGHVTQATDLLQRAHDLAASDRCSDLDRADVLFRLGACRYQLGSTETAIDLFSQALRLAEQSELPCDRLRSRIFERRSRCYRRRRDLEAAREDVERALELAEAANDKRSMARSFFQASCIAERQGRLILARSYAEHAKIYLEEFGDQNALAHIHNNLGFFAFHLGHSQKAIVHLKEACLLAIDVGDNVAASMSVCTLARVHLGDRNLTEAERLARQALDLIRDHAERFDEVGTANVVLGRALLEQGRLDEAEEALAAAEEAFAQLSSPSHLTFVWDAQADVAKTRGDLERGFALCKRALRALQDTHL